MRNRACGVALLTFLLWTGTISAGEPACARGGWYVIRMEPDRPDGADSGWGTGFQTILPAPTPRFIALSFGMDGGNILPETDEEFTLFEQLTPSTVTVDYYRVFGGVDIGTHDGRLIQPHLGVHIAVIREDASYQSLRSQSRTTFGYDVSLGLTFALSKKISLDAGGRYIKGFGDAEESGDPWRGATRSGLPQFFLGLTCTFK